MTNSMHNQGKLNSLVEAIAQWHHDRNLIDGSDSYAQLDKLKEEVSELEASVSSASDPIDDIGDIMVVLINFCERYGITLYEALNHAYEEIKDRTGSINPETGMWDKDK